MYRYRNYGIVKTQCPDNTLTTAEIERFRAEADRAAVQGAKISNLPTDEIISRGIERSKNASRNMYKNVGREL